MNRASRKRSNAKTSIKSSIKAQRKRETLLGGVIVVIVIAAAAVGGWYLLQPESQGESSPRSGQDNPGTLASDFSLIDLNGNNFKLSDYQGKVVVIDFMATWCGPCRLEMPHYRTIWEKYGDEIALMSIDIDPRESEETLRNFAQEFPYATWIWARDTANLGEKYQVVGIPKTVIIDQYGYIRFEHTGVTSASTFIMEIDELLDQS